MQRASRTSGGNAEYQPSNTIQEDEEIRTEVD